MATFNMNILMLQTERGALYGGAKLGNVRPEKVKRISRELLRRYSDKFTDNFDENKKIIQSLAFIPSPKMRNRIVGYITRLKSITQQDKLTDMLK